MNHCVISRPAELKKKNLFSQAISEIKSRHENPGSFSPLLQQLLFGFPGKCVIRQLSKRQLSYAAAVCQKQLLRQSAAWRKMVLTLLYLRLASFLPSCTHFVRTAKWQHRYMWAQGKRAKIEIWQGLNGDNGWEVVRDDSFFTAK